MYFWKEWNKMPPCIRSSSAPAQCCWGAPKQVLPAPLAAHFSHALGSYLRLCKWIPAYNEGSKALYKELRSIIRVGILSCNFWRNARPQTKCMYFRFDNTQLLAGVFPSLHIFLHGAGMCQMGFSLLVGKAFDGQKLFQSFETHC